MIGPGGTVGIIGGGQLGRMLSLAAAPLGLKCHIFDPHAQPCAADVAAGFTRAAFDNEAALQRFAADVDVVTYEFENLPVAPLSGLGDKLRPGSRSLAVAQDRAEEKEFIQGTGARLARWRRLDSLRDVEEAVAELGCPLVLKTRRYGYDGKGQAWIRSPGEAAAAWAAIGEQPAVAEAGVAFEAEFSVILARTAGGELAFFDSKAASFAARSFQPAQRLRRRCPPPASWLPALPKRWIMWGSSRLNFSPRPRARWSMRSRRACTTAAIGPSRVPPRRSSSSTSAQSAVFLWAAPFADRRMSP
jgi:formate-dependent phosphoribosylglycinamide formyltransferase (GAR transformylase)